VPSPRVLVQTTRRHGPSMRIGKVAARAYWPSRSLRGPRVGFRAVSVLHSTGRWTMRMMRDTTRCLRLNPSRPVISLPWASLSAARLGYVAASQHRFDDLCCLPPTPQQPCWPPALPQRNNSRGSSSPFSSKPKKPISRSGGHLGKAQVDKVPSYLGEVGSTKE
jgi:hypothetical protein